MLELTRSFANSREARKPEKFLPVLDFGGNLAHQAPTPVWPARSSSFADARVYNPQWKALLHC